MERERSKQVSLFMWTLVTGLLSQNLVISVMSSTSFEDQKNYYVPDPHAGSPPTGSHTSPPHGTTPSHGSGGSLRPPSHGTPSHGGGGSYGGTPPSNCGNPPSGGHHHHDPTPDPPTGGGGGGYYNSPPTYGGAPPTPTYGGAPPTPTLVTPPTPTIVTPPTSPFIDPGTPTTPPFSTPSSPPFDPSSPPGTCTYWSTHPGLIWGLLGWWGTMGGTFGVPSVPGFGANMSLQQALSNTRSDGFGALYREGAASLLNSMVNKKFPFTTVEVRESFVKAVSSNKAAAAQAHIFKLANEGRLKPKA